MRFVVDTNIIVSAYLGGALETILKSFKAGQFTLVVTDQIANEYFTVLQRPKFKIERAEFDDFVSLLMSKAEFVVPTENIAAIKSDPSDNKFVEAAVAGRVRRIVSGDNHLLELKTFRGISILTAREFIVLLAGKTQEDTSLK